MRGSVDAERLLQEAETIVIDITSLLLSLGREISAHRAGIGESQNNGVKLYY